MKKLLTEDEYLVIETLYGLDKPANFEGKWNLHRYDAWRSVVERLSMDRTEAEAALSGGRRKLLSARAGRVPPGLDDKVLTAWNGLMLAAFAEAGRVLDRPDYTAVATANAAFLQETMRNAEGRLWRTWKAGSQARYNGYLEDYAYLADGLLALRSGEERVAMNKAARAEKF